ncbi:MAG: hypothetical protein KF749_05075 [Bacteroidetes bacterium]|nr:hypothetical protein [Bacteroidota bacterium]MCW5896491.1 hypothetical protein [Bacteroidota bacterium]
MRYTTSIQCKRCGSAMIVMKRRGSSGEQYICPQCAGHQRCPQSRGREEPLTEYHATYNRTHYGRDHTA